MRAIDVRAVRRQITIKAAEFQRIVQKGKAPACFRPGDIIMIPRKDGTYMPHAVLGHNVEITENKEKYNTTLCAVENIPEVVFNETEHPGNQNDYEKSDIREYLNDEYARGFADEWLGIIAPTYLTDIGVYDRFFLLTSEDVDPERTKYDFHKERKNLTRYDSDGYAVWWWTRSPNPSSANHVRYVAPEGALISNGRAHGAYGGVAGLTIA